MNNFNPDFDLLFKTFFKFLLVIVTNTIISIERERHSHPGGVVTHILAGLGSCLFTIMSSEQQDDPARIAANIVSGMGFLGSAAIFRSDKYVKGINTAANLWLSAGLGMTIGFGYWEISFILAIMVAIILFVSNYVYDIKRMKENKEKKEFKKKIENKRKSAENQSVDIQIKIENEIQEEIETQMRRNESYDYIKDAEEVEVQVEKID